MAAGALPVAFGTSHVALVHRAQLTSGQVYILESIIFIHFLYSLDLVQHLSLQVISATHLPFS